MGWPKWVQNANYVHKCTIFWSQQWPTKAILEPNKDQASQPDLGRTSVFPRQEAIFSWKYVAFFEWDRKRARTLIEVAFDLMGWPKWVQNANYVHKCTIFWSQQWPTKAILEPNKDQAGQCPLDRTSVFPMENLGLVCLSDGLATQDGLT